jgi:hypothetical protein
MAILLSVSFFDRLFYKTIGWLEKQLSFLNNNYIINFCITMIDYFSIVIELKDWVLFILLMTLLLIVYRNNMYICDMNSMNRKSQCLL